ncbi:MAG: type II toxin-antitoxin system RelE/ParE family toxin [Burkholderiaceae bacterium]|jgi:mRNA interferase RelE/StbE|nr:MAG: type II toxin-antitoxin system RelE/ParE family toxin [Burkholderiaceae bacterium]TBR74920.1 MAG: type II toxin-antitoxin system RelE/ParE family toxin [Burkholderiaceae bacterium]
MVHSIEYTRQAVKALAAMQANTRRVVLEKIESMARDPFGAANVKKLVGEPGYRLRVGDWRVIYDVDSGRVVVRVLRVGPRGGVYK